MANIKLNKGVFEKRNYKKTIDTEFKKLGVKTVKEQLEEQDEDGIEHPSHDEHDEGE